MTDDKPSRDPRLDPGHPPPWRPLDGLAVDHLWSIGKQIDELGGEWSYPIFAIRAYNFNLISRPVSFYEPIEGFERLALEVHLIEKAHNCDLHYAAGMAGVSFTIFPSMHDAADGVLVLPEEDEQPIGQHYMGAISMRNENELVFRNTWSKWAPNNLAYVSRDYFDRFAQEGWISRKWDSGPTDATAAELLRTSEPAEFRRLWRRKQRFGTSSNVTPNANIKLKWFACWSLQVESPAEVLVVEFDKNIRVGVAILVHYEAAGDSPATSSLVDLFIWPNYRRVGYGLLLERFAAERSIIAGSSELSIHVWDADAVKGKDRAHAFLKAAGYREIQESADRQYVLFAKRALV